MSDDTKQKLKEIRACLRDGQPLDAMKKCQQLLKIDKNNYMALTMLGAALKDIDQYKSQAPMAFKKAIQVQPSTPLAWQGLVAYYESEKDSENNWNELIPAYCKLLELDSDSQKFLYFVERILILTTALKDVKILDEIVRVFIKIKTEKKKDSTEIRKVDETLFSLLTNIPNATNLHHDVYEIILVSLLTNEPSTKHLEYYKTYLKFIFAEKRFSELLTAAVQMNEQYPRELYPLEWICRIYAEQNIKEDYEFAKNFPIQRYYQELLTLDSSSYLAFFAKGVHCWKNNNYIEARDLLHQVISSCPKQFFCWFALSEINAKLHCWLQTENAARSGLDIVLKNIEGLYDKLNLLLMEALVKSDCKQKWMQAVELGQNLLKENKFSNELKLLLARAYVLLDDPEGLSLLEELENNPDTQIEATIIRALQLQNRGCLEEAIDVLGSALQTSEAWQILGKVYWAMSNYSHSLMALLKGIHANPYNWECLVYLGHYYREQAHDLEKSRKCYQKALRINPDSEEAGAGLSTAYRLLKNTEANIQMLEQMTSLEGGGPKWAWLQLGLQQLDQGKMEQAIKSLRYVIRADPNDNHCWESLADAYWARGAHTSALKSYQRALDLSPGSLYPMIQLANIKLVLGRHEEAKQAFLEVLSQEKHYIPALKGLAETCLDLAKENARNQLLGRARRHCQQAADNLTEAIFINSNFSCLWKLLGDIYYRVAVLPDKYCYIEVAPDLIKADNQGESRIKITKSELFTLTARCYCRALNITNDSSLLWHDLACCYLSQLYFDPSVDKKMIAKRSFEAAKQAIKLCPTSWVYWNILGVICMTEEIKNYALAQHCWAMAIDRESHNSIAWTNLGTLYLYLGDAYKANEAFSRAQRFDPEYQNSWIGQALIAESVAENREAMDLFRHSTQLGYHPQAAAGYAHWVLTTILDSEAKKDPLYSYVIVNMHAIPVAADAMTWYTEREPDKVFGRNALGLLLERLKILKPAADQYEAALKLVQLQNTEDTENHEDKIRVNLARVLVQIGDCERAVEICNDVKDPNFHSYCQLALSLFKAARYEESYEAYKAALDCIEEVGSDTAHILCAMASMAYMFQDVDDVKTLLFQCIQITPPIVSGLLAAAALGLLHEDFNLTTVVLQELEVHKDEVNYRHHVALLSAYLQLMSEGDVNAAIRVISKAIHRHPDDAESWIGLVRILLETNSRNFGNCAQKALFLGRKNLTVAAAQVACISSLGQLIDGNEKQTKNGLQSVQKTIFSFPENIESWANFVVALSLRHDLEKSPAHAQSLAELMGIIGKQWKKSKPMDEWLNLNYERILNIALSC